MVQVHAETVPERWRADLEMQWILAGGKGKGRAQESLRTEGLCSMKGQRLLHCFEEEKFLSRAPSSSHTFS